MVGASQRYNNFAIFLHWLMALGLLLMLASGVMMVYAPLEQFLQFQLYQWHKAGGVLLLLALGIRLVWRLISRVPPLPSQLAAWEQYAAKLGHWGLYAAMLAMPLSGWLMVSSSVYGLPTMVFGWFEWPHIPGVAGYTTLHNVARSAHFYLALIFGGLILLHIAAVIKHKRMDGINLLQRMWWTQTKEKP